MSVFDLFWLFFILSALQPVIRKKMLEASHNEVFQVVAR